MSRSINSKIDAGRRSDNVPILKGRRSWLPSNNFADNLLSNQKQKIGLAFLNLGQLEFSGETKS